MGKKKDSKDTYVVFARKWRPQTFEDVVGQEPVKKELRNALKNERIGHSYLFAGPRGVGKTSVARILAKCLNCETGITPKPCNKCSHCTAITTGNSMDVVEIDGASYNKVENIHDLQEGINRATFSARKKVYIIDEVHMLSNSAFNALLKTLEEPPPFVVFIFATTEPEKIPETVRSRCQIFHFERISRQDIIARLDLILKKEKGVKVDPDEKDKILEAVAQSSEGGLRDAEVTLDQLISLSAGKLEFEHVTQLLGLVEFNVLLETLRDLSNRDIKPLLKRVAKMVKEGRDLERFVKTLQSFARDLLILKAGGEPSLSDYGSDRIDEIRELLKNVSLSFLLNLMNNLFALEERMKTSPQQRFLLEFYLIKLCVIQGDVDINSILERIDGMEKASSTGKAERTYAASPSPGSSVKSQNPPSVDLFGRPVQSSNPGSGVTGQASLNAGLKPRQFRDETDLWKTFKKAVIDRKRIIEPVLDRSNIESFRNNTLVIKASGSFDMRSLESDHSRELMEKVIRDLTGKNCTVKVMEQRDELERNQPVNETTKEKKKSLDNDTSSIVEDTESSYGGEIESEEEEPVFISGDMEDQPIEDDNNINGVYPEGFDPEQARHLFRDKEVSKKFVLDMLKKNPDIKEAVEEIKKVFGARLSYLDDRKIRS